MHRLWCCYCEFAGVLGLYGCGANCVLYMVAVLWFLRLLVGVGNLVVLVVMRLLGGLGLRWFSFAFLVFGF